jgi:DNA polymerase III subunit delta
MINLIFGQDTYRSRERLRMIIGEQKQANTDWLDFIRIDASDKQAEVLKELKQTIDTISMFGSKKMIVVENVFDSSQEIQEEVLEFLKKRKIESNKDVLLIFWTEEAEAKNDLFKYLKSKTECEEFKLLEKAQLKKWIKDFIGKGDGSIDSAAVDKLAEWIGGDLWRMSNELNRLLAYNKTIRLENVELFIKPEIDLNIFEMVDAIGYKNRSKALSLFNQHIEDGADEYYLLSMMVYQIRNLIKVKTVKAIELLGLHPFVARKTGQQAGEFSFEELKKIYHQLMTIDFESKLGKTDINMALELFLTNL